MSEKTFKASNGWTVQKGSGVLHEVRNEYGSFVHSIGPNALEALAEFAQHQRDQELGRVRWPENPDYVIYWVPEHDDEEGRCVRVLHEPSAIRETVLERWAANPTRISDLAAKWYFTEGPGKKPDRPWEEAKAGEVWRLTVDGEEQNAVAGKNSVTNVWFSTRDNYISAADPCISAGRKLVNADGSVADD